MAHPNQHRPESDDLAESAIDIQERRAHAAAERYFAPAIESALAEARPWLLDLRRQCVRRLAQDEAFFTSDQPIHDFLDSKRARDEGWRHFPPHEFMLRIAESGLVTTVVDNIDRDDPSTNYKDRRRGWYYDDRGNMLQYLSRHRGVGAVPDRRASERSAVVRPRTLGQVASHVLCRGGRRTTVAGGARGTDRGQDGVAEVTELRFWAAVHLSSLAPETHGVAEWLGHALAAEMGRFWGWANHKWGARARTTALPAVPPKSPKRCGGSGSTPSRRCPRARVPACSARPHTPTKRSGRGRWAGLRSFAS